MSSIESLITEYVESAKKHGEATLSGDFKVANKSYDKLIVRVKQIHTLDSEGKLFLELLKHSNEDVKLWAATHALFINETMAMATIQQIANGTSFLSFDASLVAGEWDKGALKSPF